MIIRHSRSSFSRYRTALKPSRLQDNSKLACGLPRARNFHASKPNLIINEALQLSSAAFYFIHDTSGLIWGLSIPLTAGLCQLAFTPLHYRVERNKNLRAQGATLLEAYKTAYRQQVLTQKDSEGTEADAASAESQMQKKLKAKNKQIRAETGYRGNWLNFTLLSYIPVWLSNNSALVEMCGLREEDSKALSASGLNGIAIEPALTTDGMLWFTDLTVADPMCLLPLATGSLFTITVLQIGRGSTGPSTPLQSLMMTFALFSGPLFIATGISNAVLLAMMGSTFVTIVRRSMLDRLFDTSIAKVKPARPRTAVVNEQYRSHVARPDR